MIAPDNAPSIRLAERAGYRIFGSGRVNGAHTILFERP
jgi:RimJ/RimL family protein N-acetyltransferase